MAPADIRHGDEEEYDEGQYSSLLDEDGEINDEEAGGDSNEGPGATSSSQNGRRLGWRVRRVFNRRGRRGNNKKDGPKEVDSLLGGNNDDNDDDEYCDNNNGQERIQRSASYNSDDDEEEDEDGAGDGDDSEEEGEEEQGVDLLSSSNNDIGGQADDEDDEESSGSDDDDSDDAGKDDDEEEDNSYHISPTDRKKVFGRIEGFGSKEPAFDDSRPPPSTSQSSTLNALDLPATPLTFRERIRSTFVGRRRKMAIGYDDGDTLQVSWTERVENTVVDIVDSILPPSESSSRIEVSGEHRTPLPFDDYSVIPSALPDSNEALPPFRQPSSMGIGGGAAINKFMNRKGNNKKKLSMDYRRKKFPNDATYIRYLEKELQNSELTIATWRRRVKELEKQVASLKGIEFFDDSSDEEGDDESSTSDPAGESEIEWQSTTATDDVPQEGVLVDTSSPTDQNSSSLVVHETTKTGTATEISDKSETEFQTERSNEEEQKEGVLVDIGDGANTRPFFQMTDGTGEVNLIGLKEVPTAATSASDEEASLLGIEEEDAAPQAPAEEANLVDMEENVADTHQPLPPTAPPPSLASAGLPPQPPTDPPPPPPPESPPPPPPEDDEPIIQNSAGASSKPESCEGTDKEEVMDNDDDDGAISDGNEADEDDDDDDEEEEEEEEEEDEIKEGTIIDAKETTHDADEEELTSSTNDDEDDSDDEVDVCEDSTTPEDLSVPVVTDDEGQGSIVEEDGTKATAETDASVRSDDSKKNSVTVQ